MDNPELIELIRQLSGPASSRFFPYRTPRSGPDRLLRCCVMKHLKSWTFRDMERELRSNLVYRRFTRFDSDRTPHFSTFKQVVEPEGSSKDGVADRHHVLESNATIPRTVPCWAIPPEDIGSIETCSFFRRTKREELSGWAQTRSLLAGDVSGGLILALADGWSYSESKPADIIALYINPCAMRRCSA